MSQQNIDFGTYPDDPSADPIRSAFAKTQNNFNQLFEVTSNASVTSINRSPGAGITVNFPTGNVIVSANVANVAVNSPNLLVGTSLSLLGNSTIYTDSTSQTLYIVVPNTFSIGNLFANGYGNFTGNLFSKNANLGNVVVGNYFVGSGNNLSNIQAANINGTVANANYSIYAGLANVANTVSNNAQPNITSVGTLTSLSVSGNINSGPISVTGNVTAVQFIGNIASAGTVTVNAQPNITSVGTLTNLTVSGNVVGGNLSTSGVLQVTGNANVGNLGITGAITAAGNIIGGNLITSGQISTTGNVIAANINSSSLSVTGNGTVNNLTVTGNLQAGDIGVNSISYGNSVVDISNPNGNISMHVNGVLDVVVVTSTGVNIAGYLSTSGNANIGNVGATNFVGNVQGGNISGNITTPAQGNITSLGTLTGLTVSGVTNLGAVDNVKIANGINGTFLQTDGTGNLAWASVVTTPPGGTDGSIIFNQSNLIYQGSSNLIWDNSNSRISLTGSLSATGNINANFITATLTAASNSQPNIKVLGTLDYLIVNTAGYIAAGAANITAGNIYANSGILGANSLTITGNTSLANVSVGGNIIPTANVTYDLGNSTNAFRDLYLSGTSIKLGTQTITSNASGILLSNTVFTSNISTTGNINAGNLIGNVITTGTISTTGNITGGNLITGGVLSVAGNANVGNLGTTGIFAATLSATGNANVGNIGATLFVGTLATGSQPNITSTGTLTSLSVSGNANIGNVGTSGLITAAGNIQGGNLVTGGQVSASGNATVLGIRTDNYYYSNGVPISFSGTYSNSNVASYLPTYTGNITADTISASGNITGANLVTGGVISATGNANVGNLNSSGRIISTNNVIVTSTGIEGGQVVLGWVGVTNITGQANSTWNIDVDNSNSYRVFYQDASGVTGVSMTAYSGNNNVLFGNSVNVSNNASITGNVTGGNIIASNYNIRSVTTGITAAGTTQGTATALTKEMNIVSTVTVGANGVVLPSAVAGMVIYIKNTSSNTLNVFPASGAQIDTNGLNVSFTQPANASIQFIAPTSTQWYTVGATYM